MALIELEVAIEVLEHAAEHYSHIDDCTEHTILQCISTIKKVPTVDAAPVVHGRWDFVTDYTSRCTNCCEIQWIDHDKEPRYCPNCGARMDGGEEHEAD